MGFFESRTPAPKRYFHAVGVGSAEAALAPGSERDLDAVGVAAAEAALAPRVWNSTRRPTPGPVELYLILPESEIHIVYRHDRLLQLAGALAEIAATLTKENPVAP